MILPSGKQYEHLICEDCKQKIREEMQKLKDAKGLHKIKAMAKAAQLAKGFSDLLCNGCRNKVLSAMKTRGVKVR